MRSWIITYTVCTVNEVLGKLIVLWKWITYLPLKGLLSSLEPKKLLAHPKNSLTVQTVFTSDLYMGLKSTHTRNCMTYYILLSLEFARPPLSTKDDLVLTTSTSNQYTKLNRRKSTKDAGSNPSQSKYHANRYSVGDFSHLTSQINQFGSPKGYHIHSYSDGGSGELTFMPFFPLFAWYI